jgi:hypothetical protein
VKRRREPLIDAPRWIRARFVGGLVVIALVLAWKAIRWLLGLQ